IESIIKLKRVVSIKSWVPFTRGIINGPIKKEGFFLFINYQIKLIFFNSQYSWGLRSIYAGSPCAMTCPPKLYAKEEVEHGVNAIDLPLIPMLQNTTINIK